MSEAVFEVGACATVTAWHVMPGMAGPEGELHSHDYRVDVVVARDQLDDRGMVCDLDVLRAALDGATGLVRGRNLEIIQPAGAEAVTVELFARWMHDQIRSALDRADVQVQVRIWETPEAFGGYASSSS
jgi:6-pyruvoyltetrahydropterin/6-carboxytetrahydropterin synthase